MSRGLGLVAAALVLGYGWGVLEPTFAHADDETALIMGGTGNPGPDSDYVASVNTLFVQPLYPGADPVGLYTPEQEFPLTGLDTETYDQSVAQGVSNLNSAITQTYAGQDLVVLGYSQSATIATDEMNALDALDPGDRPDPTDLHFVLIGDPNNPDGGFFERFAGLYIPFIDETLNGATPADTPYPTDIFTIQYDLWADFPQYPLDVPADINALFGYYYAHLEYPDLDSSQVGDAVVLPVSPDYYADGGQTTYYEILTQDLPLLGPLRAVPYLGPIVADLAQPDLRVIIDLGYGDGYANVATTAGLFPLVNPVTVLDELALGAEQGVQAALVDSGLLPVSDLPDAYPYLPSAETPGEIQPADLLSALSESSLASSFSELSRDLLGLFDGQWGLPITDIADPATFLSLCEGLQL